MIVNMRTGDEYDVRIDRGTKWGNPYKITARQDRATVVEMYRRYLWEMVKAEKISKEDLAELHGKRLGCWCAPEQCHGDVLMRAARWAHAQLVNPHTS